MSLRAQMEAKEITIQYFMDEVAKRGGIVSLSDKKDNERLVTYLKDVKRARPIGILLDDVVKIDFTKTAYIPGGPITAIGGKVQIMTKGTCLTNMIIGEPYDKAIAVLSPCGYVTAWNHDHNFAWDKLRYLVVGQFKSRKDEHGYAMLRVDL